MESFLQEQEYKKAVIYCRVSSARQKKEGHGLEAQEHRCKEYAKNNGYIVNEDAIFTDDYTGGGDFMKRPAMAALLEYLDKNHKTHYVVIFDDLKRFARDTIFHLKLKESLDRRKAKRECLNFNFDDSPVGRFAETISAAHNQLEREENRIQVINKMKARLERGYWSFDAPPGLKYIKDPIHGKLLALDEPKASIVKEALNGFAYDRFPDQVDVQAFLQSKRFFHRKKPKKVHLEQVRRILTQILYTEYIEYKPWKVVRRKGHHQGLISLDLYERIQDKLNGTAKAKARKDLHLDFPARGFVICPEHNKLFTASWSTKPRKGYKKAFYRCNLCRGKGTNIPKEILEGQLGKILKKARAHKEVLTLTQEVALDIWNERTSDSRQSEIEARKEIDGTEKEVNLYVERIGKATNEAVLSAYEKKVEELTNKKLLLEENLGKSNLYGGVSFETALNEVFGYIKNPYEIWTNGIFEDKRLVLRMVFSQHLVYNRKSGFETAAFSLPITLFGTSLDDKSRLVEMVGVEPTSIF